MYMQKIDMKEKFKMDEFNCKINKEWNSNVRVPEFLNVTAVERRH